MGTDPQGDEERQRRYRLATAELEAGRLAQATEEFVWLWKNVTPDYPALTGVRVSFMAGQIADLVKRHPPARDVFRKLRDEAGEATSPVFDRVDWITLNTVLGESKETLEWIDACLAQGQIETLRAAEHWVFSCLVENRRWRDAGMIVSSPAERLRFLIELENGTGEAPEEHRRELRDHVLRQLATLIRTLRAARRTKEAAQVLHGAASFDPKVRVLVRPPAKPKARRGRRRTTRRARRTRGRRGRYQRSTIRSSVAMA